MSLSIKKIDDLRKAITNCYTHDPVLYEQYHRLAPVPLDVAIEDTVTALESIKGEADVFEMYNNGEFVGYFAVQLRKILAGFFVMPEYRNPEFIQNFWRIVKSKFDNEVLCGLYKNNTRAIEFIKKERFVLYREIEPNIMWFKNN